jgi:hypothetical protein
MFRITATIGLLLDVGLLFYYSMILVEESLMDSSSFIFLIFDCVASSKCFYSHNFLTFFLDTVLRLACLAFCSRFYISHAELPSVLVPACLIAFLMTGVFVQGYYQDLRIKSHYIVVIMSSFSSFCQVYDFVIC